MSGGGDWLLSDEFALARLEEWARRNAQEIGADLGRLWEAQREYNDAIKAIQTEKADWPQVYILGAMGELDEVLRAGRWKYHRPGRGKGIDRDALQEELADLTKYVWSLWQEYGFSILDMLSAIGRKSQRLKAQLTSDWFPPEGTNVIVTDLDGTVADFRAEFARATFQTDNVRSLSLDLDNAVPWDQYEARKTEWEQAGGYFTLPPYADAVTLLQAERERGTRLMVVTARPSENIHRVWRDTEMWLAQTGIAYDTLLMGRDERLVQLLRLAERRNKVLLLEDDPTLALRAAGAGFKVWMRAQPYNEGVWHGNINRLETFPAIVPWEAV